MFETSKPNAPTSTRVMLMVATATALVTGLAAIPRRAVRAKPITRDARRLIRRPPAPADPL
jgi:hypothetical protein